MRKTATAFAVLGLALTGFVLPATGAQAAAEPRATCSDNYRDAKFGYMYAYDGTYCRTYVGKSNTSDKNWGSDSNKASSLVYKGSSGSAMKVYDLVNYGGGWNCMPAGEHWVDKLSRNKFSNGNNVNNDISSSKKTTEAACHGRFLK